MMIFGFLPKNLKTKAVAVAFSIAWLESEVEPRQDDRRAQGRLAGFRRELYRCFTARADVLFELADGVLCADGPVRTLVGLSLVPEHRRGHGALYDGLNAGRAGIAGWPGRWLCCRCQAGRMGGSGWRSMSATRCARARRPARAGCSATVMGGPRASRR
jgi:hypothetical protein